MICKKHGEIEEHTIKFSMPIQPVVYTQGKEIELDVVELGETFCLKCLMEFLKKKIGTVTND